MTKKLDLESISKYALEVNDRNTPLEIEQATTILKLVTEVRAAQEFFKFLAKRNWDARVETSFSQAFDKASK